MNKETIESIELQDFPVELLNYKVLLHPTRLAIMTMLKGHYRLSSAEVRKVLGLPWGTFDTHIRRLEKEGFLESRRDIYRGSPMIVLILTAKGEQRYREFKLLWAELQSDH